MGHSLHWQGNASGNMIEDSLGDQYRYDAEGRMCAASTLSGLTGYLYDAEGNCIAKGTIVLVNGQLSCDTTQNGFAPTVSYILGPGNRQFTQMSWSGGTATPAVTNVWANGQTIGAYSRNGSQPVLHFHFRDWLGTLRMVTDSAGNNPETCIGLPYGDGESCTPTQPTNSLFTGKERDPETGGPNGNDYFGARYYASTMGQFLTPDWSAKAEPVPYAKLDNPQSLNLYRYVFDNPLTGVDLDGHDYQVPGNVTDALEGEFCTNDIASNNLANCLQSASQSPGAGGESFATLEASINDEQQAQRQTPTCSDCLQVESNHPLASGGSWLNKLGSALKSGFSSLMTDIGSLWNAKNPVVTAGTDIVGVAAIATKAPLVGPVATGVSLVNDPSRTNLGTAAIGLASPLSGATVGLFNDGLTYGVNNDAPNVQPWKTQPFLGSGDADSPSNTQGGFPF